MLKKYHKKRNCKKHPMMEIKSYNIELLTELIGLGKGLLRIEERDKSAYNTYVL